MNDEITYNTGTESICSTNPTYKYSNNVTYNVNDKGYHRISRRSKTGGKFNN
jgi:hypothetical protein